MGKPTDPHRLRCVHCHNTETPLWRTGPDGPKTLCNACGVRFKKGKLVLYKDDAGKLTAIKRLDSLPVHVPPPTKKALRKPAASSPPTSSSCSDPTPSLSVRNPSLEMKPLSMGSANKPRSRARRANAGQLPGRYAVTVAPENHDVRRSPSHSPTASIMLPSGSQRLGGLSSSSPRTHLPISSDEFDVPVQATSDEDDLFADMACLGLDGSADPNNHTLLPMPADPSSAEQFTFAFSGLGRDACLALDTPDRGEALRAMLMDRTRRVGKLYSATVQGIRCLYEHRCRACDTGRDYARTTEGCKDFVRRFAQLNNVNVGTEIASSPECNVMSVCSTNPCAVSLSEKSLCSAAVESLRALIDCSELAGFAEACLVELVAEDVASRSPQVERKEHGDVADGDTSVRCWLEKGYTSRPKTISTPV